MPIKYICVLNARKLKDMAKEEGGSSGDIRPFLLSRLLDLKMKA